MQTLKNIHSHTQTERKRQTEDTMATFCRMTSSCTKTVKKKLAKVEQQMIFLLIKIEAEDEEKSQKETPISVNLLSILIAVFN